MRDVATTRETGEEKENITGLVPRLFIVHAESPSSGGQRAWMAACGAPRDAGQHGKTENGTNQMKEEAGEQRGRGVRVQREVCGDEWRRTLSLTSAVEDGLEIYVLKERKF